MSLTKDQENERKHDWWEMLVSFFAHDKEYGNPGFRSINGLQDADSTVLRLGTIGRSVNVPVPLRPGDKNIKNFSFIYRNEVRTLMVKVTTEADQVSGGLVTTKTQLVLYALPKKALQTPTMLAWNVTLLATDGSPLKFNPSGIAQKGDRLYLIDYDTRRIIILGANEINGLMEEESITPELPPFDLDTVTPAPVDALGRGEAIGAGTAPNGTEYLFALYNRPTNSTQEPPYAASVLVRMTIGGTGALTYDTQTNMGKNTPEFLILPLGTGARHIVVPAIGGMMNGGQSNADASDIRAVPAYDDEWPEEGTRLLIGNAGTGGPRDLDISGLAASLREDNKGKVFIHTGRYDEKYEAYTYCLYETTKALLLNAPGATLEEAVELGILTVRDEGTIVSTDLPASPHGIYCWNVLYETGDLPRNDRVWYFQGSRLLVTLASTYGSPEQPGNPYKLFPLGYGIDDVGAENVQYAELLVELFRQVLGGEAQKRGVKAVAIPRNAAGDNDK